jgi:hypothetical protein
VVLAVSGWSRRPAGRQKGARTVRLLPRPLFAPSVAGLALLWTLWACPASSAERLQPSDLVYRGAFRLPEGSGGSNWEYSGDAMAYYPEGDPSGADDGYPGSLFGIGHDWQKYVSEISIPVPVFSPAKNLDDLHTAATLRPFRDVRAGVGQLGVLQELVRVGMAYLPAEGSQTTGKLYLCWGQHFQEDDALRVASHMWCDLDLTHSCGAWWIGNYSPYSVNDYLLDIPKAWANAHVGGRRLGTGRFRDGGWGGQGPALFACGPWLQGNPPPPDTVLQATPLLLYSSTATDQPPYHTMRDYHHSDQWASAAWLTAGEREAVVFVGTKGIGDCWYGLPDGTRWPEEPPYPPDPFGQRGWWSTGFVGRLLFYDPDDLAAVAHGARHPYQPQPYATLDIDQYLYGVHSSQQKDHVAAASFDRARGRLYVFEPRADGDKSLVHVWAVGGAQPDAMIRRRGQAQFRGNDIYNTSGEAQRVAQRVSRTAKAMYHLKVQNDGATPDRISVTGTAQDADWSVIYWAGTRDITTQVTRGGWTTGRLDAGSAVCLRAEVAPRPTATDEARHVLRLTARSVRTPAKRDVVKAVTTLAPVGSALHLSGLATVPVSAGVQLLFSLSAPAQVRARVLNLGGRVVRTLCLVTMGAVGRNVLLWNLQSDQGLSVPSGRYLIEVVAGSPGGAQTRALAELTVAR